MIAESIAIWAQHVERAREQLLIGDAETGQFGQVHYFDTQGSTIAMTVPAAAITDQYTYKAFGSIVSTTGTTPNNLQYLGQIGYYQYPNINRTHVRRRRIAGAIPVGRPRSL